MKVLLTSTSPIKLAALKSFLDPKTTIKCVAVDCGNPEQPVGKTGGLLCCKQRILHVIKSQDVSEFGCIFSIENAIEEENGCCYDVVHILSYTDRVFDHSYGNRVFFDMDVWNRTKAASVVTNLGWSRTVGETLLADGKCKDAKNWMKDLSGVDRVEQIKTVLVKYRMFESNMLLANIKFVDNYPKPGVLFKDIAPLLANPTLLDLLVDESVKFVRQTFPHFDYVIGLESRGFILGPLIAKALNAGFVMVRKKGKLTPPTVSACYVKEYGVDEFEIQTDAIVVPNAEVLIVDDLLATGGSFACAVKLLGLCKPAPKIVGCFALLQVDELRTQANLALQGQQIGILLQ